MDSWREWENALNAISSGRLERTEADASIATNHWAAGLKPARDTTEGSRKRIAAPVIRSTSAKTSPWSGWSRTHSHTPPPVTYWREPTSRLNAEPAIILNW
jgi:hypothetical protein